MCELTQRACIAVCNGSAALELAVKAIGIQPGDEVILPTFTIISCALAVIRAELYQICRCGFRNMEYADRGH